MKEWLIRIGCVFLGVALTLGTTGIYNIFKATPVAYGDDILVIDNQDETGESEILITTEEEVEPESNYELEAELKYQQLVEEQAEQIEQAALAEEAGVSEDAGESSEENEEAKVPANSIDAAPVKWIKDYPRLNTEGTSISDKLAVRSSYEETLAVNAFDKKVIENSTIDFSDVKITVIGDSITEGNTLPEDERAEYNWPKQLEKILGCKEVVNLGIGGSTLSNCVDHFPICERWVDIELDSDIIIVMAGSNDMLFENKWQYGELEYDKRMTEGTFCGDLDRMCSGMMWVYRYHNDNNYTKMLYINPPATILNDGVYAMNPDNMVHQYQFADAINVIAPQYEFEVIDMYNSNLLNSHDIDINANFVPDGIHCNKEGYQILAEHVASQIIQRIEQ